MGLVQLKWAGRLNLFGPVASGPLTVTAIIVSMLQDAGFAPFSLVKVAVKVTEMAEVL